MPTNDFIGFASAGSANIMSQADYAAAAEQTNGVQPGPASSKLANKIWRQGANMAAAIGQVIAAQGYDANDNGDIATLKNNIINAFARLPSGYNVAYFEEVSVPSGSTTNLGDYTFIDTGTYLVEFSATFASNSSNQRRIMIATTPTGSNYNRFFNSRVAPVNGDGTVLNLTTLISISTANTKLYFNAYQTSGTALNVSSAGIVVAYLGG